MISLNAYSGIITNSYEQQGLSAFVAGFMFILSAYHTMLFFQNKDKVYLLYGIYTFFSFLYASLLAPRFFIRMILEINTSYYLIFNSLLQWLFNTVYFLFVIYIIDLRKDSPVLFRLLKVVVTVYFVTAAGLSIYELNSGDYRLLMTVYQYFFIPSIVPLAIYTIYVIFKMKTVIKYYIIPGSIIFLVLSLIAFYLAVHGKAHIHIFYTGLILESVFFALGLGAKQRLVIRQKAEMQELVIESHKKNIELKNKIKERMDETVRRKTEEIEELTHLKLEEEKQKTEAEFHRKKTILQIQALQNQMNPHFLFNVLNSIKHYIILNKKEDASVYLSKLSRLIRKILDNSQVREIYLTDELDIMRLFVEVENMRMPEPVHLCIRTKGNTRFIKIPPLILQPFIENAIWHGLILKEGEKKICIEVTYEDHTLLISITDNGIGREKAAVINAAKRTHKASLGIALTLERLKTFYNDSAREPEIYYDDLYEDDRPAGTRVNIKIYFDVKENAAE